MTGGRTRLGLTRANAIPNVVLQWISFVTTIKPIWHRHPVRPGSKHLQFVALKARKTSSLHTIILEKQTQTKHLIALIFI